MRGGGGGGGVDRHGRSKCKRVKTAMSTISLFSCVGMREWVRGGGGGGGRG